MHLRIGIAFEVDFMSEKVWQWMIYESSVWVYLQQSDLDLITLFLYNSMNPKHHI